MDSRVLDVLDEFLAAIQGGGGGGGSDTGWIDLEPLLINGWVKNVGSAQVAYRKVNGVVYFDGRLNGTAASGPVAVIPVGFRPSDYTVFVWAPGLGEWTWSIDSVSGELDDGGSNVGNNNCSLNDIVYVAAS